MNTSIPFTPRRVSQIDVAEVFARAVKITMISRNLVSGTPEEQAMPTTLVRHAFEDGGLSHHGMWQLNADGTHYAFFWSDHEPFPERQHWRIELVCKASDATGNGVPMASTATQ